MRKMLSIGVVAVLALLSTSAAAARLHAGPDLVERSVGAAPTRLAPGDRFTLTDVAANRGSRRAPATTTQYSLTSGGTRLVVGSRGVPALKAHRSRRAPAQLTIPADAPAGDYSIVACVDAKRSVRETNERNNCRTATGKVSVRLPAPLDSDHDGTADSTDCAPHDASIHPGARDKPDLGFVDSNCDGIDGEAARSIFVAPTGDNANPGTASRPLRSVATAVSKATPARTDVLVATGIYPEGRVAGSLSPQGVAIGADGIGVYGGYAPEDWSRSTGRVTEILGAPQAVLVEGAKRVTLQLLTLRGLAEAMPGASAYDVRAIRRADLTIERSSLPRSDGQRGSIGADGAAGANGSPGRPGQMGFPDNPSEQTAHGGPGGSGPTPGRDGGGGGDGGRTGANDGQAGEPGSGPFGGSGGAFGKGGSPGSNGLAGSPGGDGARVGEAGTGGSASSDLAREIWSGQDGTPGTPGEAGSGGGGGGGGGGEGCFFCFDGNGAGGGGGGAGGGAGLSGHGGTAGGGAFGVYLSDSDVRLSADTTIFAGAGGAGGAGGIGGGGGFPGLGGAGGPLGEGGDEVGRGGNGGRGGFGTHGGNGGGGAGGPSIGVFEQGASTLVLGPDVTIDAGAPGHGGAGGGQDGIAARIFPAQP